MSRSSSGSAAAAPEGACPAPATVVPAQVVSGGSDLRLADPELPPSGGDSDRVDSAASGCAAAECGPSADASPCCAPLPPLPPPRDAAEDEERGQGRGLGDAVMVGEDDEVVAVGRVPRGRLLGSGVAVVYRRDICMQGDEETIFFDV